MTKLSVNVNKIATLRNSRGKNLPNVLKVARDVLSFGAHGITVHPRPDGRHIRTQDVYQISELVKSWPKAEFNVEGFPSEDFLELMDEIKPDQCTLVPDPPEALTSNAGWDIKHNESLLIKTIERLKSNDIRVSLFIDVESMNAVQIESLKYTRADRVELYTEKYADHFDLDDKVKITEKYREVAQMLSDKGFGINAGHDLNLNNISYLIEKIPCIDEVSIGHALISEALYLGFEKTIEEYLKRLGWPAK